MVSGKSQTVNTRATYASVAVTYTQRSAEFTKLTASAAARSSSAMTERHRRPEADVNGFQLFRSRAGPSACPTWPSTPRPIPCSISATPAAAVTLGGLSLGRQLDAADVAGGGSVTFSGDVMASANAAVVLAAGAGSVPSLVLAGTGSVQNINAADGGTLTLPALSISAGTVNVGTPPVNGSVVLNGATALPAAPRQHQWRHAAGQQHAQRRRGRQRAGQLGRHARRRSRRRHRSAGDIATNGVLQPDASQASSGLIGSSLTFAPSAVFAWTYNGPGTKGTVALGSNTLNLPVADGLHNPVFQPTFSVLPALGTLVMTWSSKPAQPAHLDSRCGTRQFLSVGRRQRPLGYCRELDQSGFYRREPQLHSERPGVECVLLRQQSGLFFARC